MRVVLAEKPSVAREIAAVLGADARRDGYFEGRGYQVTWAFGHLVTLKEPEDYDPSLKKWSLDTLPIVPERFGAQAHRGPGGPQAVRGHQPPLPRRGRADLRHGRRPRGGADLPLHPRADRLRRQAGPPPLAQLPDRGRDSRRLPPAPAGLRLRRALRRGAVPERGRLDRRTERDALLHRPPRGSRPPLERRPGPDAGARPDRSSRRRDPHLQAGALLGADDPLSRRHSSSSRATASGRRPRARSGSGACKVTPSSSATSRASRSGSSRRCSTT